MIWRYRPPLASYLAFKLCLNILFRKCTSRSHIVGEKKIDLTYPIRNLDSSSEVTVVSMLSNNVQYQIKERLKVLLIINEERQLLEGVFTDRELNASTGRKLITTPLDANNNIVKTGKLACITEMVLSLEELNNTDNLEDGRLSNILLRYHVTGSEELISFEPMASQYKRLKNGEFASLTLRNHDKIVSGRCQR